MVPAGASAAVRIRFSPEENKDYSHQLICMTTSERIVVPIRAIAARAVLDFPEQLDFSRCPVKSSTQKTVLLRNTGNLEARFQLSTQSPFSVAPAAGALGAGDTVQVTVGFHALTAGDHCGCLAVCCSTGEERIQTHLKGEAVDVNVGLSTSSVEMDKTLITMSSHRTVFIENRSNITAHFQWKAFPSEEEEDEEKRRQCLIRQSQRELWLEKLMEEKETGKEKGSCEDCAALLRAPGEMAKVHPDPMFSDDFFLIEPMVNLINQGALDAPFSCIPSATKVGLGFKLAPQEGIIAAGGSQTLQISFSATVLGRFEEEFRFSVAGSPTPAILTIRGSVTGPSLHFDLPELDFGDISFGFPYTQRCRLTNSSPVPVTFQLRMSFDGTQPAVDSVDQIRCHSDPAWRKGVHLYVEPREFTITPSQGTILPQGHQDIQVTLCSNSVMEFYRKMLVDLEGFGKGVASLVITARCLVPKLQVSPHVLQYDECLLKVPYEKKFIIRNPSHLPGCYGLIEQKRKEDSAVLYSSPRPCGIVQPHSTAEIPVLVEVQALGTHRTNVLIGVFGDERNPLASSILPVSGVLQPGESQQVSLPFSGHLNSISSATVLCHVEGGPSSEVLVPGEASRVSCSPSPQEINCGSGAPLRERRELKRPSPKLEEETKALEEEERQKEKEKQKKEKKGVSIRLFTKSHSQNNFTWELVTA
ncbi:hydrocephalus-inducing protein-like [Passer domesticus]|uniref:hydrocephalus-inducing protein-like n=1 Tax=Passer domesticus TaxID=48849 RepID=UPI0030FE2BAD